jgi:hypothetical protein
VTNLSPELDAGLAALEAIGRRYRARYKELAAVTDLGAYLSARPRGDDEEILTEPFLADLLEGVLGFPTDAYFPQLTKSGAKPDFTPGDLVAHPFVFDAKSSAISDLDAHEEQIRRYIDQRGLRYGILFNLRQVRVYARDRRGHVPEWSFPLLPVWHVARGESLPTAPEVERFKHFIEHFRHRALDLPGRISRIRRATPWRQRETEGERPRIDVEYLVDRLRTLSRALADDVADQHEALDRELRISSDFRDALLAELRTLANDIQPGVNVDELPSDVAGFRSGSGLAARVWAQYRLRVSQLALIRILLYRSWEDAGFVDEKLYDGGFGAVYDRLKHRLGEVLDEAFAAGRDRYPWLYGGGTTYDWYRPSDPALIEVLYTLLPVPLGKLDTDVLGGLYESYVDDIDRDRLGQFYTPRSVVRFMLDRAGFSGADVFRLRGDSREPQPLMDFATGSGGFLVEAARRVVDQVIDGEARDIEEGLAAISRGLHGCEISPFPYYLSEVNLLLQVSRLLGRLRQRGKPLPRALRLGIVHADTLATRLGVDRSFAELSPEERADRAVLEDRRFGLVPLDAEKVPAYDRMTRPGFAFVVGNPPYVFEVGNRALFARLRQLPGWETRYRADYLYYFLTLATERLAEGGRLAVIVPAAWMDSGQADWLRELMATRLRLDELFLFGGYRLFAPEHEDFRDPRRAQAPLVESAILIATRADVPPGHQLRITILEDDHAAARALHPGEQRSRPAREPLLAEMARRADAGRGGRRNGIFVHSLRQDGLQHNAPWPVKFGERDLASRVVAHLERQLADDSTAIEPLGARWDVFRGIETGADQYTRRIQKRLTDEGRQALATAGRVTGEPILELPPERAQEPPWDSVPDLLAHGIEPRGILYGAVDEEDDVYLVWIGRGDEVPRAVQDALEPWRHVLATRAEFVRNSRRRWYETAWERDKAKLRSPKVISLHRTNRGRFAVDERGEWQPSVKATVCTSKHGDQSVVYLCGLLNSELLDLWYGVRGRNPRDVWRDYEPTPMRRIPYAHIDLAAGSLHELSGSALLAVCDELLERPAPLPDYGRMLEVVVRALADNRRALLPHRAAAPALATTIKDPWRTVPPELNAAAALAGLAPDDGLSVRLHPELELDVRHEGPLGRPALEADALRFKRARRLTAEVRGPGRLLELIGGAPLRETEELRRLILPKDVEAFDLQLDSEARGIDALVSEGRELVERAERLVCRLYGVESELEDEVVAHAQDRARRSEPIDAD